MQEKIICPECSSKSTIRKGIRKNQQQTIQQYKCKNCSNIFTQQPIKKKTYPIIAILKAISLYNLGYSQSQIQKLLKTSPKPSQKTISNWINEYKSIATYSRLRTKVQDPSETIQQYTFMHNNLPYKYQLHNFKLNHLTSNNEKFQKLKLYLEKIPNSQFPHHIFKPNHQFQDKLDRSSQTKFK